MQHPEGREKMTHESMEGVEIRANRQYTPDKKIYRGLDPL